MNKTKIDIISGFLGAGKTTFIKEVLNVIKNEKVVLIENEFGEIGIDGGFLKESGIEIKEMNSGCICCSLVGDFSSSLREILSKYKPDRVIIEPSGVGKLSDVKKAVKNIEDELNVRSNNSITVVDVKKCKMYMKNFGEFFNNQIDNANIIILSRVDIADKKDIDKTIELIRQINKNATIVSTAIGDLSASKIVELLEGHDNLENSLLEEYKKEHLFKEHHHDENCECHHEHHHDENCECHHEHHHDENSECHHEHHHDENSECNHEHHHDEKCSCGHDHHADEVFTSWGRENIYSISKEKLERLLEKFAETTEYGVILRAKGMIKDSNSDKWFHFDLVPEEKEIRYGEADSSGKICVIGVNLKENKLNEEFDS